VANLERGSQLERVELVSSQENSGEHSLQAQVTRKLKRGRVPRKARLGREKNP
jgi:hypothetical protein